MSEQTLNPYLVQLLFCVTVHHYTSPGDSLHSAPGTRFTTRVSSTRHVHCNYDSELSHTLPQVTPCVKCEPYNTLPGPVSS